MFFCDFSSYAPSKIAIGETGIRAWSDTEPVRSR